MALPKSLTTVTPFSKLLAGILFITLVVSAFFAGMKYQRAITLIAYQQANLATSTPSPTLDSITNWETYANTEYGFKFSYPNHYFRDVSLASIKYASTIELVRSSNFDGKSLTYIPFFVVYFTPGGNLNTIRARNKENGFITSQLEYKNIIINNRQAYRTHASGDERGNPFEFDEAIIPIKNGIITIFFQDSKMTKDEMNLFDQILSTFKFTDNETSPTPTCRPRPACLDATPRRCMIPETSNMCPRATACTMEAKLCPDGKTYVSRTGPKCEFSLCP